jgi:hypothetical protein
LHHALPLWQVFGTVVCTFDLIPLAMGKLTLDNILVLSDPVNLDVPAVVMPPST